MPGGFNWSMGSNGGGNVVWPILFLIFKLASYSKRVE